MNTNGYSIISKSPQETQELALKFASKLKAGDIVCLKGDLGAGKTTFVKGLAQALRVKPTEVTSPTFIIMNYYKGKLPIYHFDFYRLETPNELMTVHVDEYFYGDGISVIEWPERLGNQMPKEYFDVHLEHRGGNERLIKMGAVGKETKK